MEGDCQDPGYIVLLAFFFKHLLYINLFDYFVAHVYVFFLVLPWVFLHFIQKLHRVKSGAKKKSTYPIMDK